MKTSNLFLRATWHANLSCVVVYGPIPKHEGYYAIFLPDADPSLVGRRLRVGYLKRGKGKLEGSTIAKVLEVCKEDRPEWSGQVTISNKGDTYVAKHDGKETVWKWFHINLLDEYGSVFYSVTEDTLEECWQAVAEYMEVTGYVPTVYTSPSEEPAFVYLCHKCEGYLTSASDKRLFPCYCMSSYVREWQTAIPEAKALETQVSECLKTIKTSAEYGRSFDNIERAYTRLSRLLSDK